MIYTYSRVSTNTQQSSSEQQDSYLIEFCARKGFDNIISIVDTDVSGGKPIFDRPGGSKLLEAKRNDIIICSKHDRMFRSLRDAVNTISDWFQSGVTVYFLNLGETPIDMRTPHTKFMLYMMMATAELEKDTISERTTKNLKFRKDNKRSYSSAPYGWNIKGERNEKGKLLNGELVRNEAEQKVICEIKRSRALGIPFHRISETLNNNNIPTKGNRRWAAITVKRIFDNELNK